MRRCPDADVFEKARRDLASGVEREHGSQIASMA